MIEALILVVLLLTASDASAQGARTGVSIPDLPTLLTYLWVAAWGAAGGLVSFYRKVKTGTARWVNIHELIGELATSAFVGVITGLLCEAAGVSAALTFALIGLTGHMGGRAIFWLENAAQRAASKRLGIEHEAIPK